MSNLLTVKTLDQRRPFVRAALFALLLLLPVFALGESASAAPSTHKLIWGPTTETAFRTYGDLGAGLYEMSINWSRIATSRPANPTDPHDPAYEWTPSVDEAIANASREGMQVVIEVTGAPGWANGGRQWRWAPDNPQDYADFVAAASRRWPEVHYWQIWGEPSRRPNFLPLPSHLSGLKLTAQQRRGPGIYAQILDAAYVSLKAVSSSNVVIGGNTFSGGDIKPLAYIKALRLPNGKPPRMDMYGQNPFGYRKPDLSKNLLDPGSGIADFCDLDVVAEYVDRYLSRAGRNTGRLPLFLSEYMLPTDHKNFEFNYWVSRKTASEWLTDALKITRSWHRIFTFGWFALEDEVPNGKGTEVNRGLLTWQGFKKPAYYAFKNG
jgi:hypothetical protein